MRATRASGGPLVRLLRLLCPLLRQLLLQMLHQLLPDAPRLAVFLPLRRAGQLLQRLLQQLLALLGKQRQRACRRRQQRGKGLDGRRHLARGRGEQMLGVPDLREAVLQRDTRRRHGARS